MALIKKPEVSKDPRRWLQGEFCERKVSANSNLRRTALENDASTDFIGGISRIGRLEIDSGVTKGLGLIASAANSIGIDANGNSRTSIINGGVNGVMDTVFSPIGFGSAEVNTTLNSINPSAVNTAKGAAESIIQRVEQGDLRAEDIPGFARDFTQLGEVAANAFNLGSFSGKQPDRELSCFASPWAVDLVKRGIKHKFMFVVEFKYNKPYGNSMGKLAHAFMVKTVQLPTTRFEYEDINMYNYRTHTPKFASFEPIDMSFYDDARNDVMNFYTGYLKTMSPISNRLGGDFLEENSMNFIDEGDQANNQTMDAQPNRLTKDGGNEELLTHTYSSTLGPLSRDMERNKNTILDEVRIYQPFGGGGVMNVYRFFNPKILEMRLSELDMAAGENTEANIRLAYDYVHIHTNVSIFLENFDISVKSAVGGAFYPIYPVTGDGSPHPLVFNTISN